MSFISWQYLLFLPFIFILYWTLSGRKRLLLLLAASYFFYAGWDVRFLALVLSTTVIDFLCGLSLDGKRTAPGYGAAPVSDAGGLDRRLLPVPAGGRDFPRGHGPGRGPRPHLLCDP